MDATPFDAPISSVPSLGGEPIDGRYVVVREIARGGMGLVLSATHVRTGRKVALKLPLPAFRGADEARRRIEREALILGAVAHPSIVEILDAGVLDDGAPYLVMEQLEGRTLDGLLAARGAFEVDDALAIAHEVARALVVVHRRGFVHRDIKPTNVFIAIDALGQDRVKLIDFGIAREAHGGERLTSDGCAVGTPEYMAPEQRSGGDVDARADVYAAVGTLFECLTGESPSHLHHLTGLDARELREHLPRVGEELARLLAEGLAWDSERRIPSAVALLRRIEACAGEEHHAPRSRPLATPILGERHVRTEGEGSPFLLKRRRTPRAPYVTPVRIRLADGRSMTGHTEELSDEGMQLRVAACDPLPDELIVELRLGVSATPVRVPVHVRWQKTSRRCRVVGVEFVASNEHAPAILAQYARTQLSTRAPVLQPPSEHDAPTLRPPS